MASHKMKRQRGRYGRESGEDETREKEGARNQSDRQRSRVTAGQRTVGVQVWRKKNKKCTKYKTLVHVPNSTSVRRSREQADDSLE